MNLSEFKQAIANEVEARKFYDEAANTLTDPHLKKLFASLAEEKKHRISLPRYTPATPWTFPNRGDLRGGQKPWTSRNCPWP